jgi:hypothetical protein
MKIIVRGLVLVVAMLFGLAITLTARAEPGCYEFASWNDAQVQHELAPWLGLDADGNGVACDCLLHGFPC